MTSVGPLHEKLSSHSQTLLSLYLRLCALFCQMLTLVELDQTRDRISFVIIFLTDEVLHVGHGESRMC